MTRPPFEPVSERDIRIVSAQLGRPPATSSASRALRCGAPTVVATAPRLSDGTPFPTFYYLTHPVATAAMSFLEAAQVMVEYNELLAADPRCGPHTSGRTATTSPTASPSRSVPAPASRPAACPPG